MTPSEGHGHKYLILAAMGTVLGLVLLDETVVGVALHVMRSDLAMSELASHWVVNAYFLVFAALVAAGGKLGDMLSLRMVFIVGIVVFGLASLAAGFSQDGAWLIAMRAVQGIGAAAIFPASMAMVAHVFPESERGFALGIYGAIGTIFLALGPLVGGFFTDTLSWRWIFWINPPIVVAIAAIVAIDWVDAPRDAARAGFDLVGLCTMVGGLFMLVFGLMQGPEWGWSHPAVWSTLAAGAILLAAFVTLELRARAPLIQVDLFRKGTVTASNLMVFTGQYSKTAVIVFGALYLQTELHMNALAAGIALLAAVGPAPFAAYFAGTLADRYGSRRPALVGAALLAVSMLWVGVAVHWNSYWLLLPALIVCGISQPFVFAPPLRSMMNAVPLEMQGQAGGIVQTAQILGGTMGMAVGSTLLLVTDYYGSVFLATGALAAAVLVLGWLALERVE